MIQLLPTPADTLVPTILCDVCGDAIRNPAMAMAILPEDTDSPPLLPEIIHVHKGPCLDRAESTLPGPRPTEELITHLQALARLATSLRRAG